MTYTPATPAELVTQLEAARDLIANAWVQGRYRMPLTLSGAIEGDCGYAYCVSGALEWSVLPREFQVDFPVREALTPASNLVREAIGLPPFEPETGVSPFKDLIKWNDAPGRTQAEVVAAVDKAIEIARQRANTEVPHERHDTQ
jgi:hypothetical protein